jgi:hypothetical protein
VNLFIFTASGTAASQHLRDSVVDGVPLATFVSLPADVQQLLGSHADAEGRVRCWGAMPGDSNIRNWSQMEAGDLVLVYQDGTFPFWGTVYAKAQSASVANTIWGSDGGRTWEHMYFLDPVDEFGVDRASVAESFGYDSTWFPRGFMRVSDAVQDELISRHGSFARFLASLGARGDVRAMRTDPAVESARDAATPSGRRGGGQGYGLSAAEKKAIEEHSMAVAIKHYEARGYDVDPEVHKTMPFDLLCMKDGEELHVEVKGTTGDGSSVLLTPGEVKHAHKWFPQVDLFVVSHITLSEGVSSGGTVAIRSPWKPSSDDLFPTGYQYVLR